MEKWNARLVLAMNEAGVDQTRLCAAVGVSAPTASAWMRGEIKSISAENALKVCQCLDIRIEWLMQKKGPMRHVDMASDIVVEAATPEAPNNHEHCAKGGYEEVLLVEFRQASAETRRAVLNLLTTPPQPPTRQQEHHPPGEHQHSPLREEALSKDDMGRMVEGAAARVTGRQSPQEIDHDLERRAKDIGAPEGRSDRRKP